MREKSGERGEKKGERERKRGKGAGKVRGSGKKGKMMWFSPQAGWWPEGRAAHPRVRREGCDPNEALNPQATPDPTCRAIVGWGKKKLHKSWIRGRGAFPPRAVGCRMLAVLWPRWDGLRTGVSRSGGLGGWGEGEPGGCSSAGGRGVGGALGGRCTPRPPNPHHPKPPQTPPDPPAAPSPEQ